DDDSDQALAHSAQKLARPQADRIKQPWIEIQIAGQQGKKSKYTGDDRENRIIAAGQILHAEVLLTRMGLHIKDGLARYVDDLSPHPHGRSDESAQPNRPERLSRAE